MDQEKIIRNEATEFYEYSSLCNAYTSSQEKLSELKSKLDNFYATEHKAIFLDELEKTIVSELKEHRQNNHNGIATEDCLEEISSERLLYYINQEIGILPKVARQKFITKNIKRNKVFISYSHNDIDFLKDIKRHFKPFLKDIDFWDDSKIEPGQKWKDEIKNAISETKVAILLVSTDFLGSDFISSHELPPLLEAAEKEGAVILTIILKPCLFEEFPELNQFQAMNTPNNTVSKMDSNETEELYVNLVRQTKRILEK